MAYSNVHICPRCGSEDSRHYLRGNSPMSNDGLPPPEQATGHPDINVDFIFTCGECAACWYTPVSMGDDQYELDSPAIELYGEDLARDAKLARVMLRQLVNELSDGEREALNERLPFYALFIVDDLLGALAQAANEVLKEEPHA